MKRPQPSSSGSSQSQTFGFKAHGDLTLDQKSKDQRRAAVSFLKSVTQCTACNQKGHWVGDAVCPLASKKGSGKGGKGKGNKPQSAPQKKQLTKVQTKPGSVLFVLPDKIESDDANEAHFMMKYDTAPEYALPLADEHMTQNTMNPANDMPPAYDLSHVNDIAPANAEVSKYDHLPANVLSLEGVFLHDETYGNISVPELSSFTDETYGENTFGPSKSFADSLPCHEVLMALRAPALCEHSVYRGGQERQFHRGANGHTRHITCKECEKNVITARRKDPAQLWSYLVQLAMCTKWGSFARSSELARNVARLTLENVDGQAAPLRSSLPLRTPTAPSTPLRAAGYTMSKGWDLITHGSPSSLDATSSAAGRPMVAKIVRGDHVAVWLYGVKLDPFEDLPQFPELPPDELQIL